MGCHQSLRWVLTDAEALRLAFDAAEPPRPWTRAQPWFVSWWKSLPARR